MEFVSGGELFDYIVSRGRLSTDEARQFFHQARIYTDSTQPYLISIMLNEQFIDNIWYRILPLSSNSSSRSKT
jgi:hypothetical protein